MHYLTHHRPRHIVSLNFIFHLKDAYFPFFLRKGMLHIFFCYYILLSKDLHVSSSFCHWTFWYARDSPLEPDAGVLINLSTFWHHLNLKSRDRGTSLKRCIVYCTGYGIPTYPHVINLSFTIIFWLEAFLTLRHFICPVFYFSEKQWQCSVSGILVPGVYST